MQVKIVGAFEVPGDIFLELVFDPWEQEDKITYKEYHRLSDIRMMAYSATDNEDDDNTENEDEDK
jgi:hypothetical protein